MRNRLAPLQAHAALRFLGIGQSKAPFTQLLRLLCYYNFDTYC